MKPLSLAHSLVLLVSLCSAPTSAADPRYRESEAELTQVRERIEQLQIQLRNDRARHDDATAQLRALDEKVAEVAGRLRLVERKLANAAARVAALRGEVAAQQQRIGAHRNQLARQLRAAYASGNGGYLKLMLNEEDPLRLGRILAYHRYLQAAHRQEMNAASAEIARLSELEQALATETAALDDLRGQELRAQQQVAAARQERTASLDRIEARIAARGEEITRLEADAASLERLLQQLRAALADVQIEQLERRPFRDGRGRLNWPLSGTLLAQFGDERGVGNMRWSGVLIEGQPGDAVRAVARGHVVFADWLRGFGLLLIIDHGDGFMTLYGHNEAIFTDNGAWVQPGDVIASVGASGAQRKPSLYFEVRSGGKPVDPMKWLRPSQRG
jgi:septal ring factor EnvC (AmiA/AmiB activator)